jgi:hypothetical protein
MPTQPTQTGYLKKQPSGGALYYQTVRISNPKERPSKETKVKDDSVFVKGESAISYDNLAKPVTAQKKRTGLIATLAGAGLGLAGVGCFLYLHFHGAH